MKRVLKRFFRCVKRVLKRQNHMAAIEDRIEDLRVDIDGMDSEDLDEGVNEESLEYLRQAVRSLEDAAEDAERGNSVSPLIGEVASTYVIEAFLNGIVQAVWLVGFVYIGYRLLGILMKHNDSSSDRVDSTVSTSSVGVESELVSGTVAVVAPGSAAGRKRRRVKLLKESAAIGSSTSTGSAAGVNIEETIHVFSLLHDLTDFFASSRVVQGLVLVGSLTSGSGAPGVELFRHLLQFCGITTIAYVLAEWGMNRGMVWYTALLMGAVALLMCYLFSRSHWHIPF